MGSGNRTFGDELRGEGRGTFLIPAHAMRLAAHPVFSKNTKGLAVKPRGEYLDLQMQPKGNSIEIIGTVTAEPPAHAIVAYFDPDGGGDYNAQTAVAVPDKEGRFEINGPDSTPGPKGELRLVVCHANGNTTRSQYPYQLRPAGQPDLTVVTRRLKLQRLVNAINEGKTQDARLLVNNLDGAEALLGKQLIVAVTEEGAHDVSPMDLPKSVEMTSLSATKVESAKVGWLRATFDKTPGDQKVLDVDGEYIADGIYAHAPAMHRYRLGKKWGMLSGRGGLQANNDGSVVFEIVGDGKTLWTSKTIKQGTHAEFQVDVTGVDVLELKVNNAGDGNASDWGIWIEPQLKR